MATSKDVAKLAGVSHTTVSRAFRKNAKIKKETYDKIMKISQEIGYVPNQIAASLRQKKTNTIGFIVSLGFNPLFLELTHSIETELAKNGYRLLISFDDEDPDLQWNILQSLYSAQVNTIIFTPLIKNQHHKEKLYKWMKQTNIHFIQLIGDIYDDFTSFNYDDNIGSYVGTKHLLSMGHRNILMAGGINRTQGYKRAYTEFLATPAFPFEDITGKNENETYNNIKSAILAQKPTAIFAISTSISYIALEVLNDFKIKINDDISFLAFDDERWLKLMKISVIAHPTQSLASAVVREILSYENCDNIIHASNITFKPFLIKRESVKKIN